MKTLLYSLLFVSVHAFSQTNSSELQAFLDLDRFEDYTEQWAQTMKGRGKPEMAKAISALTPADIRNMGFDEKRFADAFNYDAIILEILQKKFPQIPATKADVDWGYNFLKRKMNEAYKLDSTPVKLDDPEVFTQVEEKPKAVSLTELDASEVLLDVDGYAAGRTTRAVFWEASKNQRRIDLYVGTADDFKDDLVARGGKVIGEVATLARNYNPIYLVQEPGEKTYHYAITQIGGNDRLKHFEQQASLIRWGQEKGKLAPPPPMSIVGDATKKLLEEESTLTQVLRTVPKADHVVIGQKGAFERTFGSMGKIKSMVSQLKLDQAATGSALAPSELSIVQKASAISGDTSEFAMKYASDIDKIYEKLTPLLEKNKLLIPEFNAFNYDRGIYEMSDYVLEGENGKPQRWRVFSNVWGDEVLPIARSLKATGYNRINYIGTAGALPGSDLKVGDLALPNYSKDLDGTVQKINWDTKPEGARVVDAVTQVASPFEETKNWLGQTKKFAQAVEVETGFLSSVFNGPNDKLNVMLLISDAVGVEGESLAHASSSVRRKAQINAISTIIDEADVGAPAAVTHKLPTLATWIDELAPKRDALSKLQLRREAELRGINTKAELETFLTAEKSFTTGRVEKALNAADSRLSHLLDEAYKQGILPEVHVEQQLADGRFNPAKSVPKIHLTVASPKVETDLQAVVKAMSAQDKNLAKILNITVSTGAAPNGFTKITDAVKTDGPVLTRKYQEGVLKYGGLAVTETRSGSMKFIQVADPLENAPITTTAFFKPDKATEKELVGFKGLKTPELLKGKIDYSLQNLNYGYYDNYRLTEVPSLPGGELAQIVPILNDESGKITIDLKITPEGLNNSAVVTEEIIHLNQIKYNFTHPYVWAEAVANARAGSLPSLEKLAFLELEAAKVFETKYTELFGEVPDNIKSYASARLKDAEEKFQKISKESQAWSKKQNKALELKRSEFDALEKQELKFNDLVMNNDRKGARLMLEKYLPWDVMEPSEKNAWKTWLDAMENPDTSKAVLMFRGMDDYKYLTSAASANPGVFSTILMRNQGNYSRRLRSLTTSRVRFGTDAYKSNPSLLVQMSNHAGSPIGSPFLSFSDERVAQRFGSRSRMAVKIDPKRILPNAMAFSFGGEREMLVPLVVFPDEVVHAETAPKGLSLDADKFKENVEKKLGRPLLDSELDHYRVGTETDEMFFKKGFESIKPLLLDSTRLPAAGSCGVGSSAGCDCVYQALETLLKN